jgi:hypothetical protein
MSLVMPNFCSSALVINRAVYQRGKGLHITDATCKIPAGIYSEMQEGNVS